MADFLLRATHTSCTTRLIVAHVAHARVYGVCGHLVGIVGSPCALASASDGDLLLDKMTVWEAKIDLRGSIAAQLAAQ